MTELETLDFLFDTLDNILLEGKYQECDDLLQELTLDTLTTPELLVILTATVGAKPFLPNRYKLVDRIRNVLEIRDKDNVSKLLMGLE